MSLCIGYKFTAMNRNGGPLASGTVYSYSPGTNSPKVTYSDYDLSVENTNPVVLDAAGQANIYVSGPTKLDVFSASGEFIDSIEDAFGVQTTVDTLVCSDLVVGTDATAGGDLHVGGNLTVGGDVTANISDIPGFYCYSYSTTAITGGINTGTRRIVPGRLYVSGSMPLSQYLKFNAAISDSDPVNNSIFLSSSGNVIKIKDNSGVSHTIY